MVFRDWTRGIFRAKSEKSPPPRTANASLLSVCQFGEPKVRQGVLRPAYVALTADIWWTRNGPFSGTNYTANPQYLYLFWLKGFPILSKQEAESCYNRIFQYKRYVDIYIQCLNWFSVSISVCRSFAMITGYWINILFSINVCPELSFIFAKEIYWYWL